MFAFCGEDDKTVWVEIELIYQIKKRLLFLSIFNMIRVYVRKTTTCDPGTALQYQGWISEAAEDWLKREQLGSLAVEML